MRKALPRRVILATAVAGAGALLRGAPVRGMETPRIDRGSIGVSVERFRANANQEDGDVTTETDKALWQPWLALWNGDLAVADEIIAPGFEAHFAPMGGSPGDVRGPAGLQEWISGATAPFTDYAFETVVGPLADGDLVAGRWLFRGAYQGGFPGASPDAIGQRVEYAGMDLLRVEAGQIAEYWLSADVLHLLQQVGVIPS